MTGAEGSLPYAVVVNDEEQYSIWRAGRDLPTGRRPASLRRWMRDREQAGAD